MYTNSININDIYECDIEIVSSCIVVPAGWQLALSVRGQDYIYPGDLSDFAKQFHYGTRGTGGMTHTDPDSRPMSTYGGKVSLYTGGDKEAYVLWPVIPTE